MGIRDFESLHRCERMSETAERLRQAAKTGDAVTAGRLVDVLRFGGYGLRYDDIYRIVSDIVEPAEWDSLMAEVDLLESRG